MVLYKYRCRECDNTFSLVEKVPPLECGPLCADCIAKKVINTDFDLSGVCFSEN